MKRMFTQAEIEAMAKEYAEKFVGKAPIFDVDNIDEEIIRRLADLFMMIF